MKYGVFVGRFQPFHNGHAQVVEHALTKVDRLILVIGSADRARNTRNPFTVSERIQMIMSSFHWAVAMDRIVFASVPDYPDDNDWCAGVRSEVNSILERYAEKDEGEQTVGLVGQKKDHTSYYIKMFPDWEPVAVNVGHWMISATDIRDRVFSPLPEVPLKHVPTGTADFLSNFVFGPDFPDRLAEMEAKRARDKRWAAAPHPPKDQCADALVTQGDKILLVTRGKWPGKGLLAMPGGHVNEFERVIDASQRELNEETKLRHPDGRMLTPEEYDAYLVGYAFADDPYRSDFGRVITNVYHYELPITETSWPVEAGDDARDAAWYLIADLRSEQFHDDHFFLIKQMLEN